jgi:hypoxanthine phosphoribosyltransferase
MSKIACELISWDRFYDLCNQLADTISASTYRPDLIVAIGRGGWVPGRVLSDMLDQFNLTSIKIEHYQETQHHQAAQVRYPLTADIDGKRVLILDDLCDSGDTFEVAVQHVLSRGTPLEVKTASLLYKQVSSFVPDFYVEKLLEWRWITFPWAVVEDITGLLQRVSIVPETERELVETLASEYAIELTSHSAAAVWSAIQRKQHLGSE